MSLISVLVADAGRARIYTYERGADPPTDHEPALYERLDLVNPERRLRPAARHSDRQATGTTPTGQGFGIDDHRDDHEREIDRRFAELIVSQLGKVLHETACKRAVVVASPTMLGLLRPSTSAFAARGIELHELSLDLTLETTPQLHDHLATLGVLPPRRRA